MLGWDVKYSINISLQLCSCVIVEVLLHFLQLNNYQSVHEHDIITELFIGEEVELLPQHFPVEGIVLQFLASHFLLLGDVQVLVQYLVSPHKPLLTKSLLQYLPALFQVV